MKTSTFLPPKANQLLALVATVFAGFTSNAQLASQTPVPVNTDGGDYKITQMGPHSCVWQNSAGQSVTGIATGMNYSPDGEHWLPSDNSFVISPDATAFVAEKIQDPTRLAANINTSGAVTVVTPDGVTLRSTPIAIGLFDPVSGKSVVVAAITNTTGILVDAQHVVYNHAFIGGGFDASIVYSLPDTGSFHQDIIFTGFDQNFDPTVYGFGATSTNQLQIEIFTEFYDVPQPQYVERPLYVEQDPNVRAGMVAPDFIDYTLDWGNYVFGPGRAYTTTTNASSGSGVTVAKDFATSAGRTFLVESLSYQSIAKELHSLPPAKVRTSSLKNVPGARRMKVAATSIPSLRDIKKGSTEKTAPIKAIASASEKPQGLSVDYVATVSGTGPKLFSSDTTYFVAGNVFLTGPTTIENAVFKYPTSGYIEVESTLTLATTNYRTAIFTSADDNTAGAALSANIWSGYTGSPAGKHYGSVALWFTSAGNIALNNLRFSYVTYAIEINADSAGQILTLSHSQLVNCAIGVYINGGNGSSLGGSGSGSLTLNANNCLMANIETAVQVYTIVLAGNAYNWTLDNCTNLFSVQTAVGSYNLTNSIFSTLRTKGALSSVSIAGGNNGFYNSSSATFGSGQVPIGSSPYIAAGAGNYYLSPTNTSVLTAGVTNVGAGPLLSQLQAKTMFAPQSITSTLTSNTSLFPTVPRDNGGAYLSLGFHYDPIDYLAGCAVSNAVLTLNPGIALAYGYSTNYGIRLMDGSQIISQGYPNYRNYLAYYNLVQEQPINAWNSTNPAAPALPLYSSPVGLSANPSMFLRLTTISAPTGETNLLNTGDSVPGQVIGNLTLRDCEVYGAGANWQMTEASLTPTIGLTNNIFHRVPFAVSNTATITAFNNLFYGTTNFITNITVGGVITTNTNTLVIIRHRGGSSPNTNENNVFDGVTASLDGLLVDHNAYMHGGTNISGTNGTDFTNNVTWVAGPLGSYYQPLTSPLINQGSTLSTNLGLYYYTVTTNETIDGANTVSIGYHYVAVDSNDQPLDQNGDGLPDYLEYPAASSDTYNTPDIWYWLEGIDPKAPGVGGLDPDGDGLLNYQEYLYGSDPLVSEGFSIWVSPSAQYSGIP